MRRGSLLSCIAAATAIGAVGCDHDLVLTGDAFVDSPDEDTPPDGPLAPCAGFARLGPDIRLGSGAGARVLPDAEWAQSSFVVAMLGVEPEDGGDGIHVASVASTGTVLVADIEVVDCGLGTCGPPALAWTGSELGLGWGMSSAPEDMSYALHFESFTSSGDPSGRSTLVRDAFLGSTSVDLVWGGGQYVMAWMDYEHLLGEIYLTRISGGGVEVEEEVRLTTSDPPSRDPSLAWTGSSIAVAWVDASSMFHPNRIYLALISPDGSVIAPARDVASGTQDAFGPSLAWTGSDLELAWVDQLTGSDSRVMLTRISALGERTGPDKIVSGEWAHVESVATVPVDGALAVAWEQYAGGAGTVELALVLRGEGVEPVAVTSGEGYAEAPSLAWSGSVLGVAYHDDRAGAQQTWFARFGCVQ